MRAFPVERFCPLQARLSGSVGDASLVLSFARFELDDQEIETSLHLDGISLPTHHWAHLVGREFLFPSNPADGYVDGSVYMGSAHHPVDVTSICFGVSADGHPEVTIVGLLVVEFEGLADYADTPLSLTSPLLVDK
jgi:hypothetical protein